ncbi:hypothetical protein ACAW74_16370 [Fibrella sp. WM1]|uniref:hypothetical protein n=1 Tax=Fibrella musci TaxID=3242485 RepID=UPI00351FB797
MLYAVYSDNGTPKLVKVKSLNEADALFEEICQESGKHPLGYVNDTKGYKVRLATNYFGMRGLTPEDEALTVREQIDDGYRFISENIGK